MVEIPQELVALGNDIFQNPVQFKFVNVEADRAIQRGTVVRRRVDLTATSIGVDLLRGAVVRPRLDKVSLLGQTVLLDWVLV